MMLVKEVMQRAVYTVRDEERLSDVVREMLCRGVRHAPVFRAGRLVGVLSDRNLLSHRARHQRDGQVREAMTESPYVIEPDSSVASAAATMTMHKLGCLPVVHKTRVVGIVTTTDLLAVLTAEADEEPARPSLKVGDVMQTNVEVAHADDSLLTAAERMSQRGVRHLPVINGERRVIGILSDRDLRTAVGEPRALLGERVPAARLEALRVGSVMVREPYTIHPDLALESAGEILARERFGALPVVDGANCLVGIISYVDVLQALLKPAPRRARRSA